MFGFFGLFGRSHEMKRLDQAVRAVGLHPNLVPDAVELTIFNLLKEAEKGASPAPRAYHAAAEMLGFCMLGAQGFNEANGLALTEATLTIFNLLKEAEKGASPAPRAYHAAAEMLGFCMLGAQFNEALALTEARRRA